MNKAVIFIPGIKGTKLYNSNSIDAEILWQDIRFNFKDLELLELTKEYGGEYFDQDENTIIKPLNVEPLAYSEFWNRLDPGYTKKYIFGYDWRISNEINGQNLRSFIEYLMKKSKAIGSPITQFDIITHSMGNMAIRFYVKNHGMEFINKIIFTAPPFKGAPEAISALVMGQGMFFNRDEMRKLARTLPGLFELLPTYKNSVIDRNDQSEIDLFNPSNWQENVVTVDPDDEDREEKLFLIEKFIENLAKSKHRLASLDSWLENLTQQEKDRILVLVKTEMPTLSNVEIEKNPSDNPKNYINFEKSKISDEGDGVVPNKSSLYFAGELDTYLFKNRSFPIDDFKHAFFLKDNRVQKVINDFLKSDRDTNTYDPRKLIGRGIEKA